MERDKEEFIFFGGGNMAQALIKGLLDSGKSYKTITVIDPKKTIQEKLREEFNLKIAKHFEPKIYSNKIIILAVKPDKISKVCDALADKGLSNEIIISVAAGITLKTLSKFLPKEIVIIRAMPNTPCLVKKGATALISNQIALKEEIKNRVDGIFSNVGKAFWVNNEEHIDIATAVSGSGPAYFYLFCEHIINAAIDLGLSKKLATELVNQTFIGSATLNEISELSFISLRKNVTSKGGTTEAAINSFFEGDFQMLVNQAIKEAYKKSLELSKG